MSIPFRARLAAALLGLAACATVPGDPWKSAGVVFQDGDVVGRVAARRSADSVSLSWLGVRSDGDRRLLSVRMIVFDDANGDLQPQPEEQLTRWDAQSDEPQVEFSVEASFEARNIQPDVLARLQVRTEVAYQGPDLEKVIETRSLP